MAVWSSVRNSTGARPSGGRAPGRLRLPDVGEAGDLRAVRARDPARVLLEVDRRPRLDLAVEHDREVLQVVLGVALAAADRVEEQPAALRHVARDALERLGALVREVHQDDRLAGRRVEVLPRAVEVQVAPRHLGNLGRRVAEEVVRVRRRVELADARADHFAAAALDDHGVGRHGEELVALRQLAVPLGERRLARPDGAADELLPLLLEDVVRLRIAARRERLLAREKVVELRRRDRLPRPRVDRRRDEVLLEVEQLELGRLADDVRGRGRVVDAGQLDRDLVVALRADLGLRHAEAVDAAPHDLHRPVEIRLGELAVARRHRLQRHLETALEVEAERRTALERRSGDGEQARPQRGPRRPEQRRGRLRGGSSAARQVSGGRAPECPPQALRSRFPRSR